MKPIQPSPIQSMASTSRSGQKNRISGLVFSIIQRARSIRTEDVSHSSIRVRIFKILALMAAIFVDAYRIASRAIRSHLTRPRIFDDLYQFEDYSQTILYTDNQELFPNYTTRAKIISESFHSGFSLISTEKNEIKNAGRWMECILAQSRLPDEIIIVDAGSTDGTVDLLHSMSSKSAVPVKIIRQPGLNISQGRNLAISQAAHPLIAVTDFGCRPEKYWLAKLMAPFEQDEHIQASAGWYIAEDTAGKVLRRRSWPTLDQIQPDSFIPSSRSFAFKKKSGKKQVDTPHG